MSATRCSIRLVAMIATVRPGSTPASTRAAATSRAASYICCQVKVRHSARPSALSLYAGRSPYRSTVAASASATVRPSMTRSMSARAAAVSVVTLMRVIVAPEWWGRKAQRPRERPMISFWISVVPP